MTQSEVEFILKNKQKRFSIYTIASQRLHWIDHAREVKKVLQPSESVSLADVFFCYSCR